MLKFTIWRIFWQEIVQYNNYTHLSVLVLYMKHELSAISKKTMLNLSEVSKKYYIEDVLPNFIKIVGMTIVFRRFQNYFFAKMPSTMKICVEPQEQFHLKVTLIVICIRFDLTFKSCCSRLLTNCYFLRNWLL